MLSAPDCSMNHDLESLKHEYDKMQLEYGAPELKSIYFGGCTNHPELCFVFMNPTARNIAARPEWTGYRSPWVGTKNVWDLFYRLDLITTETYREIRAKKGPAWTPEFADQVYADLTAHRVFVTNLGKCTQVDARPLPDHVYRQYLSLVKREFDIIQPQQIILFGNQVSSIVLDQKVSVSQWRKRSQQKDGHIFWPIFYPVGNGRFNIDKAIEDIQYIQTLIAHDK